MAQDSGKNVGGKPRPKRKSVAERKPVGKQPRTKREREERFVEIQRILTKTYPNPVCALHHRNAWELLVATILSAQCTDERVNMVTPALFAKYPTVEALAAAEIEDVVPLIRSTGFFNNKAKNIVGAARRIVESFGGEVPRTMEELLTVPGAARKTANVVLGSGYGIPSGVVVDTHVQRVARRLAFTGEVDPVKIERDLMAIVPQDHWIDFSHELILHGRALCFARKPNCAACPLDALCFAADKTSTEVTVEKQAAKPPKGKR
ncbi:MAG: endonuclease III [Bryobacterales bacterium]|nr:endonuclease III [Bryobacterales bacterium]